MPTGVEEAVGVAAIAGVVVEMADKLSNAVQGIDTIVGWTKAQEGIKYNSHVFSFPTDDDKEGENSEPSSAASPKQPSDKSSSIAVSVSRSSVFMPRGESRSLLVVRVKGNDVSAGKIPGGIPLGGGVLQFAIALRKHNEVYFDNGQIILMNARGFDSALGTQAEIEFGGEPWQTGRYLLTFNGQINPWGEGFRRIVGAVIVNKHGVLTPHGSWETGSNKKNSGFSDNLSWQPGVGFNIEL